MSRTTPAESFGEKVYFVLEDFILHGEGALAWEEVQREAKAAWVEAHRRRLERAESDAWGKS